MSWVLIGIFFPMVFLASMSFNIYVLISLFTRDDSSSKPLKIGMSAILGLVFTFLMINGQLFNASLIVILIYGAFSGLMLGIHKEAKRFKRQLSSTFILNSSEAIHDRPFFSIRLWLSSTFRLLIFALLGLIATYGLVSFLAFLFAKSFFVR